MISTPSSISFLASCFLLLASRFDWEGAPDYFSAVRAILLSTIFAVACGPAAEVRGGDLHGTPLPNPAPRPNFILRTTDGAEYDFGRVTNGRLTFLFFGYTHCPDVCPATMANLGAVLARTTALTRDSIDVVFVTTDPDRDTPELLRAWLDRFDRQSVGLVGSRPEIEAAQHQSGVAPAVSGERDAEGNYPVSHAAQVLVFSPDDSAHVAYPFGVRQSEWAEDLPKLLRRWRGKR